MANNFSIILTIITIFSGIMYIIKYFKLINIQNKKNYILNNNKININKKYIIKNNFIISIIEFCSSIFITLLLVLIIRTFIYESFQIPSSSMMPNLLVGDFILVKKFAYALKDPITRTTLLKIKKPKRNDVAVFRYPRDHSKNFIKRIIGIPGDKIIYDPKKKELHIYPKYLTSNYNKKLSINYSSLKKSKWSLFFNNSVNQEEIISNLIPLNKILPNNALRQLEKTETLNKNNNHNILIIPQIYSQAQYIQPGLPINEWIIPQKYYFVMGDNRDNSLDSRNWGFVPEDDFIGKAIFIWFSFEKHENKWPTGLRLNHIGKIK